MLSPKKEPNSDNFPNTFIGKEKIELKTSEMLRDKESKKDKGSFSEDLADQMFLEAQELLMDSPWITNIDPIDANSTDIRNVVGENKIESENRTENS